MKAVHSGERFRDGQHLPLFPLLILAFRQLSPRKVSSGDIAVNHIPTSSHSRLVFLSTGMFFCLSTEYFSNL